MNQSSPAPGTQNEPECSDFALASASCTTLLLMVTFAAALLRLQHAFGAPILFLAATIMVGGSLLRFGQEIRAGLAELDEYT